MLTAVILHTGSILPPWVVLFALGLCVIAWIGLARCRDLWRDASPQTKRLTMAALLAIALSSTSMAALEFFPYYPCTRENWEWLLDNLGYYGALTVWYGAYGCW